MRRAIIASTLAWAACMGRAHAQPTESFPLPAARENPNSDSEIDARSNPVPSRSDAFRPISYPPRVVIDAGVRLAILDPPTTTASSSPSGTSYASHTLTADGIALLMMGLAYPIESFPLFVIGTVTWGVASPIIHFAHGNAAAGFGSLFLRGLLPTTAFGLAVGLCATENGCALGFGLLGASIPATSAIDARYLAWEHRAPANGRARRRAATIPLYAGRW